jgi:hypothetical protein
MMMFYRNNIVFDNDNVVQEVYIDSGTTGYAVTKAKCRIATRC